jgi:hypothetical protein
MRIHSSDPRHARRGVILLVVLGLLTLFAVQGIGFVMYSQSDRPGSDRFRAEVTALIDDTDETSELVGHNLQRSVYEYVDFDSDIVAVDDLLDRTTCLRVRVRIARDSESGREERRNLDDLHWLLGLYEDRLIDLRDILFELNRLK